MVSLPIGFESLNQKCFTLVGDLHQAKLEKKLFFCASKYLSPISVNVTTAQVGLLFNSYTQVKVEVAKNGNTQISNSLQKNLLG